MSANPPKTPTNEAMLCLTTSTSFWKSNFGIYKFKYALIKEDRIANPTTSNIMTNTDNGSKLKLIPSINKLIKPIGTINIKLKMILEIMMVLGSIGKLFNIQKFLPSKDKLTAGVYVMTIENPNKMSNSGSSGKSTSII